EKIAEGDAGWNDSVATGGNQRRKISAPKRLGDVVMEEYETTDELLLGLVRKMVGMVYGPDGVGKTVFLLKLVFSQMVNKSFADLTIDRSGYDKPHLRVLYLEAEDSESETKDRCVKLLGGEYPFKQPDGTRVTRKFTEHFNAYEREIINENFLV